MNISNLTILPNLRATKLSENQVIISQKFLDGVLTYQKFWQNSITVLMEESAKENNNLDNIVIQINQLPFELRLINFTQINPQKDLKSNSIVLASLGYRTNHISQLCKSQKIPCIYITEYSLATRKQIINANLKNPLLRLRKQFWENNQERQRIKAIQIAEGVQCNGTPTYESYHKINPKPLLYFDTRITDDLLATDQTIETRYFNSKDQSKIRLLFSGRLIKMKGADHLLIVAQKLKDLGLNFELFICGDGGLKEMMEQQVTRSQLSKYVKIMGILEFKTELVPFIKDNIDLFICCHRQGDPSCTYLETMSCGVPIIGYDNEAFAGVVTYSEAGWLVEMDRPELLAKKIVELSQDKNLIKAMSFASLNFAAKHTFHKTFESRISHIKEVAELAERNC